MSVLYFIMLIIFISILKRTVRVRVNMEDDKHDILKTLFTSNFPTSGIIFPYAFCVHSSAIENVEHQLQHITNFDVATKFEIYEYPLLNDGKYYDMYVVYVNTKSSTERVLPNGFVISYLRQTVALSKFSAPWDPNPTLFINLESFNILEEFVINQNLQSCVVNVKEYKSDFVIDEFVRVVTFDQSVNASEIISQYNKYLLNIEGSHQLQYFYVTDALPWLQPDIMERFNIPILKQTNSVLPIVLCHLERFKFQLNIFDLISLRLATCDFRDPYPTSRIEYEIDFAIRRNLNKIVKDGHLDLYQYAIDQNYAPDDFLAKYFIYLFQNNFGTITARRYAFELCGPREQNFIDILRLESEPDVLGHVKKASNVEFEIEGENFDRMSLSLFISLVECDNVTDIYLDTNHSWLNDADEFKKTSCNRNGGIVVALVGPNNNNFVENFISSMKTITFPCGLITLRVYCDLNDYSIFDSLTIRKLQIYGLKIDSDVLKQLEECKLNYGITLLQCFIEDSPKRAPKTWALLNNLTKLEVFSIDPEEFTWQTCFEFVADEIRNSSSKEFRFIKDGSIGNCLLLPYKFTIDEVNMKVEVRDSLTNEQIDLFYNQHKLELDDKLDYDFYQ